MALSTPTPPPSPNSPTSPLPSTLPESYHFGGPLFVHGITFADDSLGQMVDTASSFQSIRLQLWQLVRARRLAHGPSVDDPNQPSLEDDFRHCLAECFPKPLPNHSQQSDLIWNLCRVQATLKELDTHNSEYPRYYTDIHLGAYSSMETVLSRVVDRGHALRNAQVIDAVALDSVGDLMKMVNN